MSEDNLSLPVEFMLIRDISNNSGVVHDAQVVNLKMWPYIAFPSLSWHKLEIQDKVVKYSLYPKNDVDATKDKAGEGAELLTKNINLLLGDTWKVKIFWKRAEKKGKKNGRRAGSK